MRAYSAARLVIMGDGIDRGDELKARGPRYNHFESVEEG